MPQVNVTIAGRSYRMACDEGQEEALLALAADLDRRIEAFREQFGEIGDMRLLIMTALALGDELSEMKGRLQRMEREMAEARAEREETLRRIEGIEVGYAGALDEAAARVERLTRALATGEIEE